MSTKEQTLVMPDLTTVPVCEVVWLHDHGLVHCFRAAEWQGWAHDELDDHDWAMILMCGKCVAIVKMKTNKCDCGETEFIRNLRKL